MSTDHFGATSMANRPTPTNFSHPSSWLPTQSGPQTPSGAGRKRSRDEASSNLEDEAYFPPVPATISESEEEWEYGEGMTLIKPNGYIIEASSQTGTWAEDKLPSPTREDPPVLQERPEARSYKSQRLDVSANSTLLEEVNLTNGATASPSPPKSSSMEPTVDDFTIYLGIGWSRISADEHIQAAARGWAKFIENHYPVHDPEIRLQSKGLASYLVEAREGWFLFSEDLRQGRLISSSFARAFENLKNVPPKFDGHEILSAATQASALDPLPNGASSMGMYSQGPFHQPAVLAQIVGFGGGGLETDMDMS